MLVLEGAWRKAIISKREVVEGDSRDADWYIRVFVPKEMKLPKKYEVLRDVVVIRKDNTRQVFDLEVLHVSKKRVVWGSPVKNG